MGAAYKSVEQPLLSCEAAVPTPTHSPVRAPRRSAGALLLTSALAVGAAACSSGGGDGSASGGGGSSHGAPSCALAPAATVGAALGLPLQAPSVQDNGTVTVCTYAGTGTVPATVIVRFQTGMDEAAFAAGRAGFDQHQEPTTEVTGLGDAAYSSTLGTGQFQQNTIVVRKGSTELLVSAPAPLPQVEVLARRLLPAI